MSALEQKLAQYPKGTTFGLDVGPLDPQTAGTVTRDITTLAVEHGLRIR